MFNVKSELRSLALSLTLRAFISSLEDLSII